MKEKLLREFIIMGMIVLIGRSKVLINHNFKQGLSREWVSSSKSNG
jgi:hypothetical protein